ncbi:Alpha/beta hydrolase fold-3 [Metarhizium rileyi]|uniref:Alpha/beta hydrolase fold-3 n=1 Tax=Metarhizium rileyi (strain RCEF 4871) TaxID=1649241 RepID=A0A167GAM9_METRR|nr:Alpha/beta hydrolase fold-3 [Metarhizium rileyi RCEF 4871]
MSCPQTITYKRIGGLDIQLDLYLPPHAQKIPVLLWFHGGGLLQGCRDRHMAPHMVRGVTEHKYALVSADYRLAPQVGVKDILEDAHDCISFVRNELIKHVAVGIVDPTRLAVSGSSAGGYLAFLAGLYVEPKPQVILCIYPITDPLGQFFTTPQVKKLDGRACVDPALVAEFLNPSAEAVTGNGPNSYRNKMYNYMLENAKLASLLRVESGDDTLRVAKSIFSNGLPPTYVVHPDADVDVGVEQSDEVVGVMVGLGMEVVYNRPHGLTHAFDEDERVELKDMYDFMLRHL